MTGSMRNAAAHYGMLETDSISQQAIRIDILGPGSV
jgi:hypothetical protein